ncbi:ABC transporter permease [Fulvivirga ulvae]|uniref:ABC transporter permease n=1 Tax=Fulvivirga ulvae TaxID=2904245 RepID=UPI001F4774B2|nr:ABC transporter permease [Fulvivirga ulvae]UII31037.1 ABC transporter permease [Fulvivirga ulvae]
MIFQQIKFAVRSLSKNRSYLILNLLGLIGGTFAAFVIAKYVGFSLSYDNFHKNKDNIYVIWQEETGETGMVASGTKTFWGTGDIINSGYTEAQQVTRISPLAETLVLTEQKNGQMLKFNERNILAVDSNFFSVFSYKIIHGSSGNNVLAQPNAIVITESMAKKYFNEEEPLGRVLSLKTSWGEQIEVMVSAVVEDNPKNSNVHFDFLIASQKPNINQLWQTADYETYVLLKSGVSAEDFSHKLESEVAYKGGLESQGRSIEIKFIPITMLQLSAGDYILSIVGMVILIVSWINFISISGVQNLIKTKEVAVKKVMGATKQHILRQLFIESVLINGLALACVVVLYVSVEDYLQTLTHGHLLPLLTGSLKINMTFLVIFIVGTLISSILPAVSLMSQNVSKSLRGDAAGVFRNLGIRKILVVIQFAISTVLIIGIVVITQQLDFVKSYDKGIDLSGTLIIKAPKDGWEGKQERLNSFKLQCRDLPFVKEVSSSTTVPGESYRQEISLGLTPSKEDHSAVLFANGIDDKYLSLYNVEFVAGENFLEDAPWKNKRGAILNETAVKALGIENIKEAIGTKLFEIGSDKSYELIGVIKDYHKVSLKNDIEPTVFFFNHNRGSFSIKFNTEETATAGSIHETLKPIGEVWEKLYTNQPFDYYFLEERFYEADQQEVNFARLFKVFTVLSIIISCLGLYSLVLFLTNKRMKEVGIRKVFGARSFQIFGFLVRDYAGQLLLSLFIGIPVAYYLMDSWLSGYSFHIKLGVWIVPYGVIPLILMFIATVSYQVAKVVRVNPVNIFRQD